MFPWNFKGYTALSIFCFVTESSLTVTSVPFASVTRPLAPFILNLRPPPCDSTCSFVSDELSPPNFIVLSLTVFNWDTFTASSSFVPAPTFLITVFPASIPSVVIDISGFWSCSIVSPFPLIVAIPLSGLRVPLFSG